MVCNGLRCFWKPKIAANCSISSHGVAGPEATSAFQPLVQWPWCIAIGPATRCDKTGHFPAILGF